jgi:hypothetical protein
MQVSVWHWSGAAQMMGRGEGKREKRKENRGSEDIIARDVVVDASLSDGVASLRVTLVGRRADDGDVRAVALVADG